jgi:phosphoglycolate phosphatase
MRRLILFDIDGTLLSSGGAAKRAFQRAMLEVYGTAGPIATHGFAGKTDPQIARELLARDGFGDAEIDAGLPRLWTAYLRELRVELALPGHRMRVMAGVPELLAELAPRAADAVVGLLTGNIEPGARLKLASARLDGFRLGAYGSDRERRSDLPPIAVERARALTGIEFRGRDIVIIGDTPDDMTCGRALDVRAVGVATGGFDTAALREAGAYTAFDDLADTGRVLEAILD